MPLTLPAEPGQGLRRIYLEYSDGMYTGVGGGSVAVPGVLAAVHRAWERHGRIEWAALFEDAIAVARAGLPFPKTSAYYLSVTYERLWAPFERAATLFSSPDRPGAMRPIAEGETFTQPELAEALELVADRGPAAFYEGELGAAIAEAIAADGGFLTLADLAAYRAEVRAPIVAEVFGWTVHSNPPPAIGGATLVHLLNLLERADLSEPVARLNAFVDALRTAFGVRRERYADPNEVAAAVAELLAGLRAGRGETTHSSAADADGYACAVTESAGYGAGLVVQGVLLNNTLGEEELNPLGVHSLPPGARCHSNMAPTIARGPGRTVALGSPGADRIVGAIAQTFLRLALDGDALPDAVAAPRAHVDLRPGGARLCFEPGLPGEAIAGFIHRPYDDLHMYFGAVQAAEVRADGSVDAAHDPRRSGASLVV
jgi:gamma-glutamyltranspeptidase/glutathione hydrolase